jgi:hypothetical protein
VTKTATNKVTPCRQCERDQLVATRYEHSNLRAVVDANDDKDIVADDVGIYPNCQSKTCMSITEVCSATGTGGNIPHRQHCERYL